MNNTYEIFPWNDVPILTSIGVFTSHFGDHQIDEQRHLELADFNRSP